MKLRLSQQEQDQRPTSLSLDFFSSLMATQSKRNGVFQILSFNRKRERVFSTKLNDGFFIIKVMMVNQAADQLEKGLVKPLFILQGSIRNHGQGVIVIKEEIKYWEYVKEVGEPVPWKLKKENVNYKGSNFVLWSTQKIQNLHKSQSQEKINYCFQLSSLKKDPSKQKSISKSINQCVQNVNVHTTQVKHGSQQNIECQSTQQIQHQLKIKTPKRENNQERFKSILQCLLTDGSDEDQLQIPIKVPSQQKMSTNKKKIVQRKNDLQFIFNCLKDQEQAIISSQCKAPQPNLGTSYCNQSDSQSDNDFDLLQWISHQKPNKSGKVLQQTKDKTQQAVVSNPNCISVQDIFHGFINNSSLWFSNVFIKSISQQKELLHAIICDQNHRFPIHAIFINYHQNPVQPQQDRMFKVGKGILKHSSLHKINSSAFDIQFDCANCILQQIQSQLNEVEQPSQNYSHIHQVYDCDQGLILNCFGVLKDFKIFKGKTTTILHYQIVDPLTKWSIVFIQFETVNPQEIKSYLQRPITIFGAAISSYKNKKNLVRKAFTIIKYDWLPLTKQAKGIRGWMQNNSITNLDTELIGYSQVGDLAAVQEQPFTNFYIKDVTILEFKSKFTYRACSKCFKKIEDNRCRSCGLRKPSEIQNRLFLRGEIGDSSATMSVIWSSSFAQNILAEGFVELQKRWLLRSTSVWIDKGNNGNLTIVRMRQWSKDLKSMIMDVKRKIL